MRAATPMPGSRASGCAGPIRAGTLNTRLPGPLDTGERRILGRGGPLIPSAWRVFARAFVRFVMRGRVTQTVARRSEAGSSPGGMGDRNVTVLTVRQRLPFDPRCARPGSRDVSERKVVWLCRVCLPEGSLGLLRESSFEGTEGKIRSTARSGGRGPGGF